MNRFHGIFSVILAGIALTIGVVAITRTNIPMGVFDLILILAMFLIIIYSYCCKCPCREDRCGHVIFGKITKMLPRRNQGKYLLTDILSVAGALMIIITFPQFWLFKHRVLFISFWTLLIIAGVEIRFYVCTSCKNNQCTLCKNGGFKNKN